MLDHLERQEREVLRDLLALTDSPVILESMGDWDHLDHLDCKVLLESQDHQEQEEQLGKLECLEAEGLLGPVDQGAQMVIMANQEPQGLKDLREKLEIMD